MQTISLKEDIHSVTEFRANATSFISQVQKKHRPIVLTQHGKSAAVLMDVSEYERLMEVWEIIHDIKIAQENIEDGKTTSHSRAKDQLLAQYKR